MRLTAMVSDSVLAALGAAGAAFFLWVDADIRSFLVRSHWPAPAVPRRCARLWPRGLCHPLRPMAIRLAVSAAKA
jgi:hypothetical protein